MPTLFVNAGGRLRAPWRLLAFAAITAAALLVIGGGGGALAGVLGIHLPSGPYRPAWIQSAGAWCLLLALLVAHWATLRWVEHRPWTFVRLGRSQAHPRVLATGAVLGALAIGIPSLLLVALRWLAVADVSHPVSWTTFLAVTLLLFVPAALVEELLFRGYAFAVLRETWGWRWTLGVTSVIFGVVHAANPGATVLSVSAVVLAGVWLGVVLLATGSLYAAWMAHFTWNWVMAALLHTPVSGLPLPTPAYRVFDAGPDWLTGGGWGPEGGVLAIAGMGATMAVLVMRRMRRKEWME
ncbi:MAG TPA: type II CAAX endopeptidase family protein [Gemmatimonadaceae bacterium]|nr:type II CAAX endopeptidase family protein [Gemmatimonadaceae bacterium]